MLFKRTAAVLVVLVGLSSELRTIQTPAVENKPSVLTRRVLIVNEVNVSYPAVGRIDEAIRESIQGSKYRIDIYREYLETALFPDEADQRVIRDSIIHKYQDSRRPDVIITVGSSPLKFMAEEHHKHFAGIPVIFSLGNGVEDGLTQDSGFTGVTTGIRAAETLDAALKLLPNTTRVVVVSGSGLFDRRQVQEVKAQLNEHRSRVNISYFTDLAMPELLDRLRNLSKDSIVLFTSMSRDATGTRYSSRDACLLIHSVAKVPVFTLFDINFGYGEVGGKLSKVRAQGTIAGNAVLKILDGVSPNDIPVARAPTEFIFDWRALQRWGLKESKLPPGSTVINREPSAWEKYRRYIIAAVSLIVLEALLISALLLQRRRARKAEAHLGMLSGRLIAAQEDERRRVARELHDDYNQRLALVASDLDGLRETLDGAPSIEIGRRIHELRDQVSELAGDLHSLSHRLHSSTLEKLGLVAGVRAFCNEFAQVQGLQVNFVHENIPPGVPPDVALSLFRITQEALRNVKRHSGADRAEVRLELSRERLHLSVSDRGRGFYPRGHPAEAGIGIQSMEERLRLVGGHLEIHSQHSEGTRIDVYVPLKVADQRAS
jgi:signal transduction histidine kinase